MKLEQEFTIPLDVARAWEVLLDVEHIAPCFPGAVVTSVEGDTVKGTVKVKLGPVLLTYSGIAEFKERDAEHRRVVIDAKGTDVKGNGSASAQVTAVLQAVTDSSTKCCIVTDLNITGRPAQFGRGMMLEIGNKILGQFSDNLATNLAAEAKPVDARHPTTITQPPGQSQDLTAGHRLRADPALQDVEALDLLKAARGAALRRLVPVAAVALAACAVIIWWVTR
jgi:carbon monoxide dehydrogenase subunit G